ncbi:MAG: diguanylate cyclase [Desulfobacter sp.]|nr:diguanylate cyclase [Desulfobacter sp.]
MIKGTIPIDRLIAMVVNGGTLRTGVDVYDRFGTLLLAKETLVDQVRPLENLRNRGLRSLPLAKEGGVFDKSGNAVKFNPQALPALSLEDPGDPAPGFDLTSRMKEIQALRKEACQYYAKAKDCLKKAMAQIQSNQGQFDHQAVAAQVTELVNFSGKNDHPFSYMAKDLFLFDQYLFSHGANVCALGTAVVNRFNRSFSKVIQSSLWPDSTPGPAHENPSFSYYCPEELDQISLGLFIFDLGKALVPQDLLNKTRGLTREEFEMIQRHSYEFGGQILEKNHMDHPVFTNMVQYHHGPLFAGEKNCYPFDRPFSDIPIYVRICKLVDIYDAMISRRSYKEAANPVTAATALFRTYVKKDPLLQFILHAFVNTIGLYPPGSIVFLKNGQMAYVLESCGPIVLPFTDSHQTPLTHPEDPFDVKTREKRMGIDNDRSVKTPKEVLNQLPLFIREIVLPGQGN